MCSQPPHCTAGETTSSMKVLLGEHRIDDNSYTILELVEPVTFSASIAPACMPADTSKDFAGELATVSGWGTLQSGGNQPAVLHSVDVTVTTNAACKQAYGNR